MTSAGGSTTARSEAPARDPGWADPLPNGAVVGSGGLLADPAATLGGAAGIGMAIVLTFALIGIPMFGGLVGALCVRHFALAVGERPRSSPAPHLVATALYGLALVVGFAAVALLSAHGPPGPAPLIVLPLLYVLVGWIVAPTLFFAMVSLDPKGPPLVRERIGVALRVTELVPAWQRLAAIALSGVALFAPPVLAGALDLHDTGWLVVWASLALYPVAASAILVVVYRRVRGALADDAGLLPAIPGHLSAHALLAAALGVAAARDATPGALLFLVLLWGLALLATQALLRAHRLGRVEAMHPGAAPGRRAFTGRLQLDAEGGGCVLGPGGLSFAFEPGLRRHGVLMAEASATLVGTFAPPLEGFRESARQTAPADGVLYGGGVEGVLKDRVRRAVLVAHGALALASVVALVLVA
ncbi:MAG: hypothetical protein AAGH15_23605 [Myxococcota bacterium]